MDRKPSSLLESVKVVQKHAGGVPRLNPIQMHPFISKTFQTLALDKPATMFYTPCKEKVYRFSLKKDSVFDLLSVYKSLKCFADQLANKPKAKVPSKKQVYSLASIYYPLFANLFKYYRRCWCMRFKTGTHVTHKLSMLML